MTAATSSMTSGLVIYDEKRQPQPYDTNQPQMDNGTHSGVNRQPAAMHQVQRFLLGQIRVAANECKLGNAPAPCDCTTGACN
jgi:hypothetical protein